MAQFRGLLRGVAYGSRETPSGTLGRFEVAASGLGVSALATTVLVQVGPPDSAGGLTFTWSNAGHVPPAWWTLTAG